MTTKNLSFSLNGKYDLGQKYPEFVFMDSNALIQFLGNNRNPLPKFNGMPIVIDQFVLYEVGKFSSELFEYLKNNTFVLINGKYTDNENDTSIKSLEQMYLTTHKEVIFRISGWAMIRVLAFNAKQYGRSFFNNIDVIIAKFSDSVKANLDFDFCSISPAKKSVLKKTFTQILTKYLSMVLSCISKKGEHILEVFSSNASNITISSCTSIKDQLQAIENLTTIPKDHVSVRFGGLFGKTQTPIFEAEIIDFLIKNVDMNVKKGLSDIVDSLILDSYNIAFSKKSNFGIRHVYFYTKDSKLIQTFNKHDLNVYSQKRLLTV